MSCPQNCGLPFCKHTSGKRLVAKEKPVKASNPRGFRKAGVEPQGPSGGIQMDPKHNKQRSQSQERHLGKEYLAAGFPKSRRVPMSGAVASMPADVDPGALVLVEAKQTRTGKMTFDPKWLLQVREQASRDGREGVAHCWFAEHTGDYGKVVVIPEEFWFKLLKQFRFMEKELGVG